MADMFESLEILPPKVFHPTLWGQHFSFPEKASSSCRIMGKVCFCDTLTETPIVSSKYISSIAQAQEAAWNVDTSAIKTCVPLSFTLVHFQGKNRIKSSLCQESTLIPWSTLLKQKVEGNSATEGF